MPKTPSQPDTARRAQRRRIPSIEPLEPRIVLDSGGVLVGADPYLTLSFASDGAAIGSDSSTLHATFNTVAPTAAWTEAILSAFQTWAVHTNADIGVVTDSGDPFGSAGASQRDPRFGDIRIGASELSPAIGAVSAPIDNLATGTWLADVIFNSQFDYQTLDEVLAVALHEAGNVFGLEDNSDPNSPLFTGGAPVVHDPTPADILALQELYGVRAQDGNEQHKSGAGTSLTDNNTLANATRLKLASADGQDEGSAPSIVYGDIHDATDLDFFAIKPPSDYTDTMTVRLATSGISLLKPELTVYNQSQQQIGAASSLALGGSVLELQIAAVSPGDTYYFQVGGAEAGLFGVGGYSLTVTFDDVNVVDDITTQEIAGGAYRFLSQEELAELLDSSGGAYLNNDQHTDDEQLEGVELVTAAGFAQGTRYTAVGSVSDATDVDFYRLESPNASSGPLDVMTVSLRAVDVSSLQPTIEVFEEHGASLPVDVLVNGAGELVVQLEGVEPGKEYSVRVAAEDPAGASGTGNYRLTVAFSDTPVPLESLTTGTLGGATEQVDGRFYLSRFQLFHLVMSVDPASVASPTTVTATVRDEQGAVVAAITAAPGQTRSAPAVLLAPGKYYTEITYDPLDGSSLGIPFELRGMGLSDPFVGDPNNTTGHPFACPDNPDFFCYPGLPQPSPDPFLWDDFVGSLPEAPPDAPLEQIVALLLGDWWSWYWIRAGVNGPPLAQDDTMRMSPVVPSPAFAALLTSWSVLDNDFEPEGEPFTAVLETDVAHGVLVFNPDGTFDYTPDAGFAGIDSFTYTASDSVTPSLPATVSIVVQLPGDYDFNGVVDQADYQAWLQAYGTNSLAADGNGDGRVNSADYSV
ncbi:MAG: cadherin-like domain-containing protein, partial [Planctomycetales bacterium]|nr:cadherin-like domain-containing protein [Planctomycetales bacterium]